MKTFNEDPIMRKRLQSRTYAAGYHPPSSLARVASASAQRAVGAGRQSISRTLARAGGTGSEHVRQTAEVGYGTAQAAGSEYTSWPHTEHRGMGIGIAARAAAKASLAATGLAVTTLAATALAAASLTLTLR